MIFQSGRASAGAGRKARWREMRRSELVTVPSFSPQPVAGSRTSAKALVSVFSMMSDVTTKGTFAIAAATPSASGNDTAGLVEITHSALICPSAQASNRSTAFSPGLVQIVGLCQNPCTALRCASSPISRWFASILARPPTSRPPMALGWPVNEKGPIPALPMRPVARWQFRIAFTLSVPQTDWLTPWEYAVTTLGVFAQSA